MAWRNGETAKVRRVFFWLLIAALTVALVIFSLPFLEGVPLMVLWAAQAPWPLQPWGVVLWLIGLAIFLAPVIAVWLVFREQAARAVTRMRSWIRLQSRSRAR
jgi:hypothetical protein